MPRIGKIFDFLEKEHLDCVVIKDVNTIRYLTGFRGDSSILYADDRRAVLVTDGRYLYQARIGATRRPCPRRTMAIGPPVCLPCPGTITPPLRTLSP